MTEDKKATGNFQLSKDQLPKDQLPNNQLPKILLVDDEASVLEALKRVLRQDFKILTAGNAAEGMELLLSNLDCSIVLSDFRMPGQSGIDFLKEVKNIAPNTVRAILSGQIDLAQLSEAINSVQIHRFILKPWDNDFLKVQMLEALQSHITLTERNHLRVLAVTDPITGLTNHRFFQEKLKEQLKQAIKKEVPLSIVMIDVDHFKSFNDQYGHPEGDRLLSSVANRIEQFCPNTGTASRYGGEEFSLILPAADNELAFSIAEKLRQSFEKTAFTGPHGRPAYITISLGVSSFPQYGSLPAELVSSADRALYQAKRQGRNQTVSAKS